LKRIFTVLIQQEDNWYVANCPENNVASQGKTIDDAISGLREALELYYEGEPVPVHRPAFVTTLEVAI
jgi:predicted RNase H-like HicB family nuclease